MIEIKVEDKEVNKLLDHLLSTLENNEQVFKNIADILLFETEQNFMEEGRPKWLPHAESTRKNRLAKNKGSTIMQMLQDSGLLASSITPSHGRDFAAISTNVPYAAAQHKGVTIHHPAKMRKTKLAKNKDATLKRQSGNPNLAVFAKSGKKSRDVLSRGRAYDVTIPARPYLPFTGEAGNEELQPETKENIIQMMQDMLKN